MQIKQRVVSQTEPELGVGRVERIQSTSMTLVVYFPDVDETRTYNLKTHPLRSHSDDQPRTPLQDLSEGNIETSRVFDLKKRARELRAKAKSQGVLGFLSPKIRPLSHQLYVAKEVAERLYPRVLLADEVGLGKTIEAGLIFSALRANARGERVMIITPNALVHQWMHEMYRRFGEMFTILDEDRCLEEEGSGADSPFTENNRVILTLNLFLDNKERLHQALEQTWDLIIVDEAHHLTWSEATGGSLSWEIVRRLGQNSTGLLLLTATPTQKGTESQFGLMHLLDPKRFDDFTNFVHEADKMSRVAELARELESASTHKDLKPSSIQELKKIFSQDPDVTTLLSKDVLLHREDILKALLDRHGTGRILFRNRRARIQGFPLRKLHSIPLVPPTEYLETLSKLSALNISDTRCVDLATGRKNLSEKSSIHPQDSRLVWLHELVVEKSEKILIICASKDKAKNLEEALRSKLNSNPLQTKKIAVFHEDLSVLDRDRQAAQFADPKGVQILISSEIGGEGRNFQFCKNLVIYDLPMHPDLLEQRIGRLDRIGQGQVINIYVPWYRATPEEALFRWYQEGFRAFEKSSSAGGLLLEEFAEDLIEAFKIYIPSHPLHTSKEVFCNGLTTKTKEAALEYQKNMEASVDVLIDLNSFHEEKGAALVFGVEELDDDPSLEMFVRDVFDHYGVDYEDFDDRGNLLVKGDSLSFLEKFPGLPQDGEDVVLTFDRNFAMLRESATFLTFDHPMVESILDLLIDKAESTAALAKWDRSPLGRALLVDLSIVLEARGPKDLDLHRFLPTQLKTLVFDHRGKDLIKAAFLENDSILKDANPRDFPGDGNMSGIAKALEGPIQAKLETLKAWSKRAIEDALLTAQEAYEAEISRLIYLQNVGSPVSEDEISRLVDRKEETLQILNQTKLTWDAMRLILTS